MDQRNELKVAERRGFLKALGLATGAAAAAAAAAPAAAQTISTTPGRPAKEGEAERVKTRYRETDHVRAFYRTNRY
jgi:anaerobic selenocysteine-containing dehydrogenase